MDLGLTGRTVAITGASRGIGQAAAWAFAHEGCSLILVARGGEQLQALAGEITAKAGVAVLVCAADLRDRVELARVGDLARDADVLVNNAGDIPAGGLAEVDAGAWRRAWELKVLGYIDLCRLIHARMAARGEGVILNNIGGAGERLAFDYLAGSTGNAALMAFTRALGSRSLDDGVRVVGINPGTVLTERAIGLYRKAAEVRFGDPERHVELLAPHRQCEPRDVADLMVFLASDRARHISGSIVTIDGGAAAYHELGGR